MNNRTSFTLVLALAGLAGLALLARVGAQDSKSTQEPVKHERSVDELILGCYVVPTDEQDQPAKPEAKAETPTTPVKAKPISDNAKKGLAYLVNQQHDDGGWGQGGGWRTGDKGGSRIEGANVADPSDLGSTCAAVLALLRAGNTPKEGDYAKNVAKAVDFILGKIDKADQDSLYVTDDRGTQIQSKIGPYVDTFLSQLVMAELKGKMPTEQGEKRLLTAFDKTMAKIAKHQQADGNFANNQAWASALSMSVFSKGVNRAEQNGFRVPHAVLAADQRQNSESLATASRPATAATEPAKPGTAGPVSVAATTAARPASVVGGAASSDAGVRLYSLSGNTSGLQDAINTLKQSEQKNRATLDSPTAPPEAKVAAKRDLDRLADGEKSQRDALDGLIRRLDDKQFIQGFGSNGGEEFLSYMNISETLVVKGGKDWEAWDKGITESLVRVQDKDGGWSGQHCITGRTFCTATALLTMLADRAPIPVVKK